MKTCIVHDASRVRTPRAPSATCGYAAVRVSSTEKNPPRFRLVRGGPDDTTPDVASYTNRHGVTYYLHEIRTKAGHRTYTVRRSIQDGALRELPEEYDFSESLNGRVNVRRTRGYVYRIPISDLELVRAMLGWHEHLDGYVAERLPEAIMIHEPDPDSLAQDPNDPNYLPLPPVRPVIAFSLVNEGVTDEGRVYDLQAAADIFALRWNVVERGHLRDLAVRYFPRLRRPHGV